MNMQKEYRKELKQIVRTKNKCLRDLRDFLRTLQSAEKKIGRERVRAYGRVRREVDRLNRRAAILQGRLS